ncbi:MAG: diguanylate cyclase [Phycisphaerae bacterium]|nr:diguanylate cyclase [Phycisphaerae bacterium]
MSLTLLLYWFPIFVGVAFGVRLTSRRDGMVLGSICALLWVAVVQANTAGLWENIGLVVSTLCGAVVIALAGYYGSRQAYNADRPSRRREGMGQLGQERAGEQLPGDDALSWNGHADQNLAPAGEHGADEQGFAPQSVISVCRQFDAWLEVHRYSDDPWADFDEFLRGAIFQWVGGTHVRTYRVLSEDDQLIPLREMETNNPREMMSARQGVEGYVATTGRSYVVGDSTHGLLVDRLTPELETRNSEQGIRNSELPQGGPAWCFPIARGTRKIGVVTVGRFATCGGEGRVLGGPQSVGCPWAPVQLGMVEVVIAQFWNALTEVCRSRTSVITDPGSGGLTRKAFFEIGREVLADAYRQGEPVIVAVIGMEGLRGLDDEGRWETADDIRATISSVLKQRLRAGDRLGRFDDSRFILLLRRVDSELGCLIMKELMGRLSGVLDARKRCSGRIELRCGVVGTGVVGEGASEAKASLENLASAALESCRRAREASVMISTDLHPAPTSAATE